MIDLDEPLIAALIGLLGGVLLGLAGQMGRFCTLGAIEDALYGQDYRRFRMWILTIGLTIIGTYGLLSAGIFSLADTMYAARTWDPMASIIGGLIFGYGMGIAGNCGFGALVKLGGGDLRSFLIVIVMGISAYMTIGGPLGLLRVEVFPLISPFGNLSDYGYAQAIGTLAGASPTLVAMILGAGLVALAFASRDFRSSPGHLLWSMVVALAILSGWAGLGALATESFDSIPVESHTFTAPVGETVLYLMTASGGGLGFSIGSVTGVLAGAAIGSLIRKRFRWEACEDPRELGRQMLGGFLMGIGAVLSVGCSIGQGLTAFSTLALSAPVVLISIVVGAAIALRQLIQGPVGTVAR